MVLNFLSEFLSFEDLDVHFRIVGSMLAVVAALLYHFAVSRVFMIIKRQAALNSPFLAISESRLTPLDRFYLEIMVS